MSFQYKIKSIASFCLAAIVFSTPVAAQDSTEEPSLAALQTKIAEDPNNLSLHEAYIKASGFTKWGAKEDPAFINQYKKWMKQFPKSAIIPYALGHAYAGKESPKAKPYLLKATQMDPNLDIAYFDLWIDAERWGQFDQGTEYLKKAAEIKPGNADYAFYYASSFSKKGDEKLYEKLSLEVAERFPKSERGAQALYWLAVRNHDKEYKSKIFELLKSKYSPAQFNWSASGMSSYYNLILVLQPQKAWALADELEMQAKDERSKKNWTNQKLMAAQIIYAKALMDAKKTKEAVALLDGLKMSSRSPIYGDILLLKAAALKMDDNVAEAYSILSKAYAISPETAVGTELFANGLLLNKSKEQIKKEIAFMRDTAAKAATDFSLNQYFSKGKASLANYKGKVILLTYWFPGCGPCRGEFPHFQNVVNKFDKKDLEYVGINIVAEQNDYVIPFMKSSGYTFIPLEDVEGRVKGNLDNGGAAPVNFILDQSGRIIFKNFRTEGNNEDVLYEMIASTIENFKK